MKILEKDRGSQETRSAKNQEIGIGSYLLENFEFEKELFTLGKKNSSIKKAS